MLTRSLDHKVTISKRTPDGLGFGDPLDISNDVTVITTQKRFGEGAGGFSITVTPALAKSLSEFSPNDMVKIYLPRISDGSGLHLAMAGLLSRTGRSESYGGQGEPDITHYLSGWDLGKILIRHNIGWDISKMLVGPTPLDPMQFRLACGMVFSGTPAQCVESVMTLLLEDKKYGDVHKPPQLPWLDRLVALSVNTDDTWETFDKSLPVRSGSSWDVMRQAANIPWNYLSTETAGDGRLTVTLGEPPIDRDSGSLVAPEVYPRINDVDVVATNLSVGDEGRVNWLRYDAGLYFKIISGRGNAYAAIAAASGFTKYDETSVAVHGYCPMEIQSAFGPFAAKPQDLLAAQRYETVRRVAGGDPLASVYLARIEDLWNRYRNVHTYKTGTMTLRGNPELLGGMVVVTYPEKWQFFVEHVSHNYVVGVDYTTNLELSRGEPFRQSLERPWV